MAVELDDLQVAAALAEMIYRRNEADQPIDLGQIGATDDPDVVRPESLTKSQKRIGVRVEFFRDPE